MAAVLVGAAVLAAACGSGITGGAQEVTDRSARLHGQVRNTEVGEVHWHFEYGPTDAYGSATPVIAQTIDDAAVAEPVSTPISGLVEGAAYHYRLCVVDVDGAGTCGADATFTTTTGHDWVAGSGVVFELPQLGYVIGGRVDVQVGAGDPATGSVSVAPGSSYFRLPDQGPITCVRVDGNRASIGFVAEPYVIGDPNPPTPRLIVIEDNGPTGDRWGVRTLAAPAATCPAVTDADFTPFVLGGVSIPPVVTDGDFVVHDHAPS